MIKKLMITIWCLLGVVVGYCGSIWVWRKLIFWHRLGNIQGMVGLIALTIWLLWTGGVAAKILRQIYGSKDVG